MPNSSEQPLPRLFCCSCCFHRNSDCQAKSGEDTEDTAKDEFYSLRREENKQRSQIHSERHCKQWSLPSTSPRRIAQCYYLVQTLNNDYCFVLNELAPDITATCIIITCLTLCKKLRRGRPRLTRHSKLRSKSNAWKSLYSLDAKAQVNVRLKHTHKKMFLKEKKIMKMGTVCFGMEMRQATTALEI